MSVLSLILTIISISLLLFYIINKTFDNKLNNDLLFFIYLSIIYKFSLIIFYYYFQDNIISLIISFAMMINSFFIIREAKLIDNKYPLIIIPYYIMCIFYFSYLLTHLI